MVIKMNIKNKIKELMKIKNKDLPQVILANDDKLKQRLTNSYISVNTISECLNLILSELGIKPEEQVIIKNLQEFSKEEKGHGYYGYYIECYKNTKFLFKLGFDFEPFFNDTPKLIVVYPYTDIKEEYEMYHDFDLKKPKISIEQISYEQKYQDGTKYHREYSPKRVKYLISKGENELVLTIEKPYNQETPEKDKKDNFVKYKLNNETELVNYLVELNFPITIEDVYKKICEISLGENVSDYPYIYLYATNKKNATDSIEIVDGNWIKFRKTKNDKTIVINQNGTWEYELNDNNLSEDPENNSQVKFLMKSGQKEISYKVIVKTDSELDDYTETLAMYDISTARKEVENTKKLVKQLIPEKNNK